jgi:Tol biopolymer transport system component
MNIQIFDLASGTLSTVPGSENLFSPRWSPDGRFVAALSEDYKALLRFDVATQKWTKWVEEPNGLISFPAWSWDSKSLCYMNVSEYRKVAVGENRSTMVASLKNVALLHGQWGTWATVAPDGSPLFVRDISTQEIYALDVQLP